MMLDYFLNFVYELSLKGTVLEAYLLNQLFILILVYSPHSVQRNYFNFWALIIFKVKSHFRTIDKPHCSFSFFVLVEAAEEMMDAIEVDEGVVITKFDVKKGVTFIQLINLNFEKGLGVTFALEVLLSESYRYHVLSISKLNPLAHFIKFRQSLFKVKVNFLSMLNSTKMISFIFEGHVSDPIHLTCWRANDETFSHFPCLI